MRPLRSCPVCGGTDLRPFAMDAWQPGVLHIGQARCAGCGLCAAQPQATEEELALFYQGTYYEEHPIDAETHWQENVRDYPRYELPLLEQLWAGFAPPPGGRVAEIGCGHGSLLTVLRDRGHDVRGVELSPSAAAFCRAKGLDVREGVDFGAEEAAYDLVASFQVIEHVLDPRAFVRRMIAPVKPGGVVAITTENLWTAEYAFDRLRAAVRGRPPPYRTVTQHTFVFQGRHLERLLREEGCDVACSAAYRREPARGSAHFRVYREAFRALDALAGGGEYLAAVGRRARRARAGPLMP